MASFWYTNAKYLMAKGDLDFDTADLRALLAMTNTTADTEKDKLTCAGFTTLDEYDGSGYSRYNLATETVNKDDANFRAEIDCADAAPMYAALGAGTRQAQGMVVVKYVDGAGGDIPIAWIDSGGFPFSGNGGVVNLTINAEGLLQVT